MTKLFSEDKNIKQTGPVECLGLTFPNDEERRKYFTEKLREHLKNPKFRKIEGFPIGTDEDILKLSDPPYYTACPNPFIEDFIKYYGKPYNPETDNYRREPFAADVSEGKNDPIYNAHSYHTKVPHKAIMRYILHYTEPGDIVFDGFCGTGMTGVAAQLCGDKKVVDSLGYKVLDDGTILDEEGKPFSKLGSRRAVLNDLSPAATFIAYNYNTPVDVSEFEREAKSILKEVEDECGWMYATIKTDQKGYNDLVNEFAKKVQDARTIEDIRTIINTQSSIFGHINYTVWSDVFICPECVGEIIFWDVAVDKEAGKVREEFSCPHCNAKLKKKTMERAWITRFDKAINQTIRKVKQVPVLLNYSIGKKRFEKIPDAFDVALIEKIANCDISYWFPTNRMPEGDESRRNDDIGITHVHHFYTKRNLWVLGTLIALITKIENQRLKESLFFGFNNVQQRHCIMNTFRFNVSFPSNITSGTLYIPSMIKEANILDQLENKYMRRLKPVFEIMTINKVKEIVSSFTASATANIFQNNSFDYIFTDPPFGGNLMYSELNFLWEAWLRVFTNNKQEAIENKTQEKGLLEYQSLMTLCFQEYYRILKPGRWMTVEFHNSKNSVWNAIQEALQHAGFVIADVRTLDKKQGTFKQVTSSGAVKQDLIISAYKPNGGLEERFKLKAGTEEGVWDFARTHLRQLPVFVQSKDGRAEVIAERMNYLLFDRMVAFHVQRGISIPISAAEFYAGLEQRFPSRDGMYFLSEQAAEYDKKRMTVKEVLQLQLFVTDEASAILWLKQQLTRKPQTFQEIHPQFMKEIGGWQKHEKPLELLEMLEQNFLRYDGKDDVPSQIHSYLSTNFKELRNLPKDDPSLRDKAKDRWYIPDPNKAQDLEKLRERALLKDFEEYKSFMGRKLKSFRIEAVRAGFKRAWQERDYQTIISVSKKIPENVLQEDPKLLMWHDQAVTRMGVDL